MSAIPSSRLLDTVAHPVHYTIMLPPFLTPPPASTPRLAAPPPPPDHHFLGRNGDANVQFIPFDKSSHGENPIWKRRSKNPLQSQFNDDQPKSIFPVLKSDLNCGEALVRSRRPRLPDTALGNTVRVSSEVLLFPKGEVLPSLAANQSARRRASDVA